MVVVIGRYETDPDIVLDAVVLEIGGNAEQVKGNVVSDPVDNQFLLLADDDSDLVVELLYLAVLELVRHLGKRLRGHGPLLA